MIICNDVNGKLYLLEAKFFTHSKNRIGVGDGTGGGFQTEILSKKPAFFKHSMRWVFGKENDDKNYLFSNVEFTKYLSGGGLGPKQNNFQSKLYENNGMTESEFIEFLYQWLS